MISYDGDKGEALSARGDENSCTVRERESHNLLRPVFINAVEVGYAFSQCDKDRRLNVRGVTIALWYFISRGHQALALLPYCFKSYADKSSSWAELMALFKMNLVEFTPGFGSDKYVEVNRILATRADEVGGCIVARSQMHNIVEERPHLNKTIERRLLMPSFNGNDIIFPVDGPLGRSGPTLHATLECPLTDEEWGRCSLHQMALQDQKIWMQKLSNILPEQLSWCALYHIVNALQPTASLPKVDLPSRAYQLSHARVRPPETNPIDGKGYSYTRASLRRANPDATTHHGAGPMQTYRDALGLGGGGSSSERDSYCDESERTDPFLPEYMRTGAEINRVEPRFADTAPPLPNFLGNAGSIYLIRSSNETVKPKEEAASADREEIVKKLAAIFGLKKAVRVADKNPRVKNVNLLIEFALNDSEGDNSCPERTESSHSMDMEDPSDELSSSTGPLPTDLIDLDALSLLPAPLDPSSLGVAAAVSHLLD